ncbi:hypothetical protein [Rhodomicrobium lacus]|uniref:hypothetical protein n=1 Tax=Rhodomicrobium lacus TaxID=2498452 RepID=UPI000F8F7357|nr:hypothetical protein [Rhodomicrobium lacus]
MSKLHIENHIARKFSAKILRRAIHPRLATSIFAALSLSITVTAGHEQQLPASWETAISRPSADRGSDGSLVTIWEFPHRGIARFCYDKEPAVIYFKYDISQRLTSIMKKDLNGAETSIGSFPEGPDERSLSCSDDGRTVAALNVSESILFVSKDKERASYKIPKHLPYSVSGVNSLLSPDGESMILPEMPALIDGPDVLKEMKVFISGNTYREFLSNDYVFIDEGDKITELQYDGNTWIKKKYINKKIDFYTNEIAKCDNHYIASLGNDDGELGFVDLSTPTDGRDWLNDAGVQIIMRLYSKKTIYGRYGICAFTLLKSDARIFKPERLARVDATGLKTFSFSEPDIVFAWEEVSFSKDGCYALIQRFSEVRERFDFTAFDFTQPQHVRLLGVKSEQCDR